jgi:endoglucanase
MAGIAMLVGAASTASADSVDLIGLNVAGAEFAGQVLPGKHGTNYFFPKPGYYDRWAEQGIRTIRFPIKWERLQPALNEDFDPVYASLIDNTLEEAAAANMRVILDVHAYARYRGKVIGTDDVPISAYQDLMERIVKRWGESKAIYAWDLMNEPHSEADQYWPQVAQAGIDSVRKYDSARPIYVEGRFYSSSFRWPKLNDPLLDLVDPADNLVFSAHVYIDHNSSGLYNDPVPDDFDTMRAVQRLEPFVEWLKANKRRGQIGEFGVPGDDPRWLEALDNALAYLQENCIPFTYWAAGPSWGNHKLAIDPRNGEDRPQWKVLQKYIGQKTCADYGPPQG